MRLKRKCSALIALLLILAGCVLRFAMPGHDYLGYLLWGVAVLVFLFPRLHRVGRTVLGVLMCAGLIVFTVFEIPVVRDARTDTDAHPGTIIVLGAGVNGSTPSLSMCNRLDAALAVLSGLDGTGILEHVASINVEKDYDIIVQYDDRYTIRLGGTDDLAYKIQYLTSILAELSDFQAGTIDLTDAANKKATFQPAG